MKEKGMRPLAEVATAIAISQPTLRKYIREGLLKSHQFRGMHFISDEAIAELEAWLSNRAQKLQSERRDRMQLMTDKSRDNRLIDAERRRQDNLPVTHVGPDVLPTPPAVVEMFRNLGIRQDDSNETGVGLSSQGSSSISALGGFTPIPQLQAIAIPSDLPASVVFALESLPIAQRNTLLLHMRPELATASIVASPMNDPMNDAGANSMTPIPPWQTLAMNKPAAVEWRPCPHGSATRNTCDLCANPALLDRGEGAVIPFRAGEKVPDDFDDALDS